MNLTRMAAIATCTAFFASGPVAAADVDFTATLTNACTLAVPTPGVMALNADGTVLGSEQTGGVPAVATILAIGSASVTVGAPDVTVTADGANYDPTGEVVEVKYLGASGLSLVDQDYSAVQTTFNIGTIPLSALTVNARVTNPNSFDAGSYRVRTVVTCS